MKDINEIGQSKHCKRGVNSSVDIAPKPNCEPMPSSPVGRVIKTTARSANLTGNFPVKVVGHGDYVQGLSSDPMFKLKVEISSLTIENNLFRKANEQNAYIINCLSKNFKELREFACDELCMGTPECDRCLVNKYKNKIIKNGQ